MDMRAALSSVNNGRRKFIAGATAASLLGAVGLRHARAEPAPEITKLHLMDYPAICGAPMYLAEALLKAEGFSHIEFIKADSTATTFVGPGKADFDIDAISPILRHVEEGHPYVMVSGVHTGCYELFGSKRVQRVRDLRGKRVPVNALGGAKHMFLASISHRGAG